MPSSDHEASGGAARLSLSLLRQDQELCLDAALTGAPRFMDDVIIMVAVL
jgi:hypothetical protein